MAKATVIIPIYQPDDDFTALCHSLTLQENIDFNILLLETVSDVLGSVPANFKHDTEGEQSQLDKDQPLDYSTLLHGLDFEVVQIPKYEFNHGLTRTLGAKMATGEIVIFLTQDAICYDKHTLENILAAFANPLVAVAYGRQLPKKDASPIATHARLFNYPEVSYLRSFDDKTKYGIKTAFCSDSFAAYRKASLEQIGYFPKTNVSEDMLVTAKLLLEGFQVAYVAEAMVYHSHNLTLMEEFRRYREIGAFTKREAWLGEVFGKAEGEGMRFVLSEIRYLLKTAPLLIPSAFLRNLAKFLAYKL